MLNSVNNMIHNLEKMIGQSEIVNCKDEIIETKIFTHKMVSIILKYMFLLLVDKLLDINVDDMELEEPEYDFQITELEQDELDISTICK